MIEKLAKRVIGFAEKGGRVRVHTGSNGVPLGIFLEARRTAYEHEHLELGHLAADMKKAGLNGHWMEFANPRRPDVPTQSKPATRIPNEMQSAYSVIAKDTYGDNDPVLRTMHQKLKKAGISEVIVSVPALPDAAATAQQRSKR